MNYNTHQFLWNREHECHKNMTNGGPILNVCNGCISNGHEILARFTNDADAITVLLAAGFRQINDTPTQFKA